MPRRDLQAAVGSYIAIGIELARRSRRDAGAAWPQWFGEDYNTQIDQSAAGAKRRRNFYFRTRRLGVEPDPIAARDRLRNSGCGTFPALERGEKYCAGAPP